MISVINILQVSEYSSFVSLGSFIYRYFILSGVMVSGIVSLISLSDLPLLAWKYNRFLYINFASNHFIEFIDEI